MSEPKYYNHPLLKRDKVFYRRYQVDIGIKSSEKNTLVVLPTALGKTIIALISLVHVLKKAPSSKILVLAPTRPLVMQHYNTFREFLSDSVKCILLAGSKGPVERAYSINKADIVFSTPQIIKNDVENGLYSLEGFGQVIFDEAHKARGRYSYTYVAQYYLEQCSHPVILALTASPGKDLYRINELCSTLMIEEIIFRNESSDDIAPYIYTNEEILEFIELDDNILKVMLILDTALRKIRDFLIVHEILPKMKYTSKVQFIRILQDIKKLEVIQDSGLNEEDKHRILGYGIDNFYNLNFPHLMDIVSVNHRNNSPGASGDGTDKIDAGTVLSKVITGIYLEHLKEILTTQDVRMFFTYLNKLHERAAERRGAVRRFLNSSYIKKSVKLLKDLKISPKLKKVAQILVGELKLNPRAKFIVFVKYREMGQYLVDFLNAVRIRNNKYSIIAKKFVGQATRTEEDRGMTQNEQVELIREFSAGKFNVLVATSVAEEGLDIPNVDAVIFYDMVPSEIRLIQRRGRTGRHRPGRCYYLVTKNTLDEIYHYVSHRREEKMRELLDSPELIRTVDELPRSAKKPIYVPQDLEKIKEQYQKAKIEKELIKAEELLLKISEDHPDNGAVVGLSNAPGSSTTDSSAVHPSRISMDLRPVNLSDITAVRDETMALTKKALAGSFIAVADAEDRMPIKRAQKTPQKSGTTCLKNINEWNPALIASKGIAKKYVRWFWRTLKVLGSMNGAFLYCSIDDLYDACKEEGINSLIIERIIDICRASKIIGNAGNMLYILPAKSISIK